jgi:pimeloyl-ACP methyl ester carboxylesterase
MKNTIHTVAAVTLAALLGAAALNYGASGALLAPLEERLLFSPRAVDKDWLRSAFASQHSIEEVALVTPDGVTLRGWLKRPNVRAGKRYPLVIVYGGVRREVSDFVRRANAPGDWGWLVVNYRGFGLSEGAPSEQHVLEDAKLVYDWAAARPDVDASSIVVLGRSLGTYVAVAVAAARHARAAILATPFDSFVALGEKRFPSLPVEWLIGGRYDSAALAPKVSVPALFLLAENDDVTPVENGRALASLWGGLTKTVLLRGATHFGIERRDDFWRSVGDYLGSLKAVSARESSRNRSSGRLP